MDPDDFASTRDDRDDHRMLLLVGAIAALIVAAIAIRPVRRALSSAWRVAGGLAIVTLVAERLGISRDELFESVDEDEVSDDEWEFLDEAESGEPPVRRKPKRPGATPRR